MAPLIGVIAPVIAGAIGVSVSTVKIGLGILLAVASLASQFLFNKKPKAPTFNNQEPAREDGYSLESNNPVQPRRHVYGYRRVGGHLAYMATTSDNQYLHWITTICNGPVAAVPIVFFDDYPVYADDLDGSGNITSGRFAGKARIKIHLGATDQVADADAVAELSDWTSDHRGRGVCYVYIRFEYDRDVWSNGRPEISALIKGEAPEDIRVSPVASSWTPNAILCFRDYLRLAKIDGGYGLASDEVDDTENATEADTCDEFVTAKAGTTHTVDTADATNNRLEFDDEALQIQVGDRVQLTGTPPTGLSTGTDYYVIPVVWWKRYDADGVEERKPAIQLATSFANALAGTAVTFTGTQTGAVVTKAAEPRYTVNAVIDHGRKPGDIVEDFLSAMHGRTANIGGIYRLRAGEFRASAYTFSEKHLVAKIRTPTVASRRERFNRVSGSYADPANRWIQNTYPQVAGSSYLTDDNNEKLPGILNLPFTSRASTAQRLATMNLKQHRNFHRVEMVVPSVGLNIHALDTFAVDNTVRGWTGQLFETEHLEFSLAEDGTEAITIKGRAVNSGDYDFDETTEEILPNPIPRTSLPDGLAADPPSSVAMASGTTHLYTKADGTIVSRIYVSFVEPTSPFVDRVEWEYAREDVSPIAWQPAFVTPPGMTSFYIWDAEDGVAYRVRGRSVLSNGRRSSWATVTGHTVVGKTAPPTDVDSLTAQQNGNTVTLKITHAAPDADLAVYRYRFIKQSLATTPFPWDAATPLDDGRRGVLLTTVSIPPGDWRIAVKAVDTSGNESTNSTTADITVSTENTVVEQSGSEAPRWPGTRTNMEKSDVSGKLRPASTVTAQNMSDSELWDTHVHSPVSEALYEGKEIDLGHDAPVRLYGTVQADLGPGETGVPPASLQMDHKTAAGSYDGFEDWTVAEVTARYAKGRVRVAPVSGGPAGVVEDMSISADAEERTESGSATIAAAGGTTVTFATPFHSAPLNVQATAEGTSGLIVVWSALSATSVKFQVFDTAGNDVGGDIAYSVTGV